MLVDYYDVTEASRDWLKCVAQPEEGFRLYKVRVLGLGCRGLARTLEARSSGFRLVVARQPHKEYAAPPIQSFRTLLIVRYTNKHGNGGGNAARRMNDRAGW